MTGHLQSKLLLCIFSNILDIPPFQALRCAFPRRRGLVHETRCDDEVLRIGSTGLSSDRSHGSAPGLGPVRALRRAGRLLAPRHVPDRSGPALRADRTPDARPVRPIRAASRACGPAPCSGAFCSGQPAAPAVPAGVTDGRIVSWVWCSELTPPASTATSFLSLETSDPQPMYRFIAVFRPPRHLSPD